MPSLIPVSGSTMPVGKEVHNLYFHLQQNARTKREPQCAILIYSSCKKRKVVQSTGSETLPSNETGCFDSYKGKQKTKNGPSLQATDILKVAPEELL